MRMCDIYEAADIFALPIDPVDTAETLGIKVIDYKTAVKYTNLEKETLYRNDPLGFCFLHEGKPCIALNKNACGERRQRFTAAHELGHCLMGHLGKARLSYVDERAADNFAAAFLAPLSVLNACEVRTPQEISRLCGLSYRAAEICLKRLAAYDARGVSSEDDRRTLFLFEEFLRNYRGRRAV